MTTACHRDCQRGNNPISRTQAIYAPRKTHPPTGNRAFCSVARFRPPGGGAAAPWSAPCRRPRPSGRDRSPEAQLPIQRHRRGHVAGVGLQARDIEAEVAGGLDGGDHEVPADAETAGFGGDVQALQLAHAGSADARRRRQPVPPSTVATSRRPLGAGRSARGRPARVARRARRQRGRRPRSPPATGDTAPGATRPRRSRRGRH